MVIFRIVQQDNHPFPFSPMTEQMDEEALERSVLIDLKKSFQIEFLIWALWNKEPLVLLLV